MRQLGGEKQEAKREKASFLKKLGSWEHANIQALMGHVQCFLIVSGCISIMVIDAF